MWTCRQQWSSFLLCHLHSHWKIQRLSPPSLTEQGQDQGHTYLTIKLKWIINDPTLLLRHLLNHGVDSNAFLVFSDHGALVLITVAIWKEKKKKVLWKKSWVLTLVGALPTIQAHKWWCITLHLVCKLSRDIWKKCKLQPYPSKFRGRSNAARLMELF